MSGGVRLIAVGAVGWVRSRRDVVEIVIVAEIGEVIAIRVNSKSTPNAGVCGRKGRVGTRIGASSCSIVVENDSVVVGEGR